jgi:hypothetical protein
VRGNVGSNIGRAAAVWRKKSVPCDEKPDLMSAWQAYIDKTLIGAGVANKVSARRLSRRLLAFFSLSFVIPCLSLGCHRRFRWLSSCK